MGTYESAGYALIQAIVGVILHPTILVIVMPFILIFAVVRFLRWSYSQGTGTPDYSDSEEIFSEIRTRTEYARERLRDKDIGRRFRR